MTRGRRPAASGWSGDSCVARCSRFPSRSTVSRGDSAVGKALTTTMTDEQAARLSSKYPNGPLPKTLDRKKRMKAYEARYVAGGGRKAEKWRKQARNAEIGRNVGLVGGTTAAAALLAARGKRTGAKMAAHPVLRHVTPRRAETAALTSALGGGWNELYGEHARRRQKHFQSTPAGIAGSALSRMQAYTPGEK